MREGTLLGLALSLNNVGGGLSAGLVHLNWLWTALGSAAVSFLVLWQGSRLSRRLGGQRLGLYAQVAAGVLLVLIGLHQFL